MNIHLVGEIKNGTADPVTYVKATAILTKNNNVFAIYFSITSPTDLGQRGKASF